MRGVLTLAGAGTRMLPWTRGLRKEFLPLWDHGVNGAAVLKPVAHIVLETLIAAGVTDVTLVIAPKDLAFVQNYFTVDREFLEEHAQHAERLRETEEFYDTLQALRLRFAVQDSPRGFGDAVAKAEPFVGHQPFLLHAADAVLLEKTRGEIPRRMGELLEHEKLDAVLLVRRVTDPRRYGVIEGSENGTWRGYRRLTVKRLQEKPRRPRSHWAATAVYAFSRSIFPALERVRRRSAEGELELTDAIQATVAQGGRVAALVLDPRRGSWRSAGSPEGFLRALTVTRRWVERTAS